MVLSTETLHHASIRHRAHRNGWLSSARERAERWRSCMHSHWVRLPTAIDVTTTFWAGREFDCQKRRNMANRNEFLFLSLGSESLSLSKPAKNGRLSSCDFFLSSIHFGETTNENVETYVLLLSIVYTILFWKWQTKFLWCDRNLFQLVDRITHFCFGNEVQQPVDRVHYYQSFAPLNWGSTRNEFETGLRRVKRSFHGHDFHSFHLWHRFFFFAP